jgi:hypothetical protein
MNFFDNFKGNYYKNELENLQQGYDSLLHEYQNEKLKYEQLATLITPDIQNAIGLKQTVSNLEKEISDKENILASMQKTIKKRTLDISSLDHTISIKKEQIVCLDDEITVQEFGLYEPHFHFANALGYKDALSAIRAEQKSLIKNNKAVTGDTNWQVNGNASKGKKMVTDTQKLLLRAFNNECDELINSVKYTNFDASLNRIRKSAATISKLGAVMDIAITAGYLQLKEKELRLAFEYQCKKQEEKEDAKAARAEQREQAKIQKELEEQRRKIEKEQTHYQTAYEKLKIQLAQRPNDADLLKKKIEMENQLLDINKALTDIDYRQANMKAGYVYVISNIGSFGENIYKIGMTRRLNPQERIDELGDASVPFNFDVHAMIFSDDAPALETALHHAFENRKLNMVNSRREFFHVTLDEIKEVIKSNFDKTVEFIDIPDAEQYRVSKKMRTNLNANEINSPKSEAL